MTHVSKLLDPELTISVNSAINIITAGKVATIDDRTFLLSIYMERLTSHR